MLEDNYPLGHLSLSLVKGFKMLEQEDISADFSDIIPVFLDDHKRGAVFNSLILHCLVQIFNGVLQRENA